jgi:hypothetical protein
MTTDSIKLLAQEVKEKPWKYATVGTIAYRALRDLATEVVRLSQDGEVEAWSARGSDGSIGVLVQSADGIKVYVDVLVDGRARVSRWRTGEHGWNVVLPTPPPPFENDDE